MWTFTSIYVDELKDIGLPPVPVMYGIVEGTIKKEMPYGEYEYFYP